MSIPKIKMKVFGHSGVGKTTLIESMRAGIFSGLFRRSKRKNSVKKYPSQGEDFFSIYFLKLYIVMVIKYKNKIHMIYLP